MEITWYGLSCFRITERGKASIVTDPYADSIGELPRNLKANIATSSHDAPGHNNLEQVKGAFCIAGPGEYEIADVFVIGIDISRKSGVRNTLYVFDFEGMTICHLGDLSHVPSQTKLESLGEIDVAMVPVGDGSALNAAQAAEVISMLEPGYVIPMHYQTDNIKLQLDPLDKFLKEMGLSDVVAEDSFSLRARGTYEETKVVVLNPRV